MQGKTHIAIGIATGVGVACTMGETGDVLNLSLTIVTAAIASILPDIDEDGSLINNIIFPSLNRKYRSFALAFIGVVMVLMYFVKALPEWVLLTGIFAAGVAYVPHRSVSHSLAACAYVTGTVFLAAPAYAIPVMAGYLSHLVADTFTSAGVPYLWPYKKRMNLKKLGIKVKTGGIGDQWTGKVAILIAALGFVYLIGQVFYDEAVASGWIA
ncbi:metal-dependent hydrolase [Hazenella coriacea]|uniref:LexA-binding, inner membrane-associated putative hydrolase n=1 Tax=Hazenella coriacea TaxID=1179467 RepID=A0A4R3L9G6_9BACL|nr:metal-dependent hydrolase [Hazenella coriacea]TCS96711.1 LexA-binding, inner membrane-associated putative hydrolase [Hazenella coriacea]